MKAPEDRRPGPAIILVMPQLGENIGMVARAMGNCGLGDLRLVRPRDGWPNPRAVSTAAASRPVLDAARLFATTAEAVADLSYVCATTARSRHGTQVVLTARAAAAEMRGHEGQEEGKGATCGVIFGRESWGLDNDDTVLADALLTVPLNPGLTSLNLAQAVLVVGYEWYMAAESTPERTLHTPADTSPATKEELLGLFEHLERELDACGFLRVREKRPIMVRNLRKIFGRAALTDQEVRTLRGVIACLVEARGQ